MAGQIWTVAAEGGFAYSDELSDYMRIVTQQLTKFRQFCDTPDGEQKGLNRGDLFHWNVCLMRVFPIYRNILSLHDYL
jgi:hypothetical protein